ncbi:Hypothetical predicted protein [Cloeon dipterum]|uniref:Uncharacterized protein n=1 Tax=Cloeon dipterum TaxID=197152 RepID=A0A8S1E550_9INSE|nr:Hypothetical predicted protein [Cloeon dipterum]
MSQTPPTNSDGDKTPPCGVPRTTETSDEYTVLSHLPTLCVILTTCVRPTKRRESRLLSVCYCARSSLRVWNVTISAPTSQISEADALAFHRFSV